MSQSNWELWAIVIVIIEFDINYVIYLKTQSFANILTVITTSIIFALAFILFNIFNRLKELSSNQEEFNKTLIRYKELEDVKNSPMI